MVRDVSKALGGVCHELLDRTPLASDIQIPQQTGFGGYCMSLLELYAVLQTCIRHIQYVADDLFFLPTLVPLSMFDKFSLW